MFVTTPFDDPAYADQFAAGCAATGVPLRGDRPRGGAAPGAAAEPGHLARLPRARTPASTCGRPCGRWRRGAQERGARVLPYHEAIGDPPRGRPRHRRAPARQHHRRGGRRRGADDASTPPAHGPGQIAEMAGIEGVHVMPGRGIMIAMNHRLVNTVINRCPMPTDGDIIVPIRTVCVIGTTDVHTEDPDDHTVAPGRGRRDARRRRAARARLPAGPRAARVDRRAAAVRGPQGGRLRTRAT